MVGEVGAEEGSGLAIMRVNDVLSLYFALVFPFSSCFGLLVWALTQGQKTKLCFMAFLTLLPLPSLFLFFFFFVVALLLLGYHFLCAFSTLERR